MWLRESCHHLTWQRRIHAFASAAVASRGSTIFCLILALALLAVDSRSANAFQDGAEVDTDEAVQLVEVGFGGKFKVGAWTPVHFVIDPQKLGASRIRVELQTIDGDGVRVTHRDTESTIVDDQPRDASGWISLWRSVRIGRLQSTLTVRVLDDAGLLLASRSLLLDATHGAMPSTDGLIIGMGPEIGFRQWLSDRQGKIEERHYEYVAVDEGQQLAQDPLAYEAVDLLIVAIGDGEILKPQSNVPWAAIAQWVKHGGVMVLCGAEGAEALRDSEHPLTALLPGPIGNATRVTSSAGAENFVSANDQLLGRDETYTIMPVENPRGRILAYERVETSSVPLVVDTAQGMGRVVWLGADPSVAPMSEWKSRSRLLGRLVESVKASTYGRDQSRGGQVSHLGYSDLTGQLRSALDRYQRVSLVTFSGVAAVVVAFILLIGPVDYWLVTRVLKRPELTWLTSSVLVIALTLFAALAFRMTKGDTVLANQLEMVDVDAASGSVRGTVWTQLYSPQVREFDLSLSRLDEFQTEQGRTVLAWQGASGTGLGGMDQNGTGASSQGAYDILHSKQTISLDSVAVQVASSRALVSRWWDQFETPIRHRLYIPPRNNSLHGDFTNPFPFTLDQAVVFYDDSAFILNEDIQPGETISIEGQTTERTLEALLARRQFVQGSERSEAWDTANSNLNRISQMLAFHEAVGGRNYTTLTNTLHGDIDWSPQLTLGQAVLYARCSGAVSSLNDGTTTLDQEYDQRVTIIRVILPVELSRSQNN